jgi:hypothetical protein
MKQEMIIVNGTTACQITCGKITTVDGRVINTGGKSIEICDGKIFVGGTPVEEYDEAKMPVIKVEITGNVESLTMGCGDVTVNGNVGSVANKNGNVYCDTVEGDVDNKNGNVTCKTIQGDVTNKNGNIMRTC